MTTAPALARPLGTMVAYGFARGHLETDLAIAARLGCTCVEVLPDWRAFPDPIVVRARVADAGISIHSAHGCWGGQSISAPRVDLGHPDPRVRLPSLDDLRRCLDWLAAAGGAHLIVHPGGLSDPVEAPARRAALVLGLLALADHVRGTGVVVCVENMPMGVHPGSRMADLAEILDELDRPELALALDTGHAQITSTPAVETCAAGRLLRTTHVHDNDGRQDSHLPPGLGSIDWDAWRTALDVVNYEGPVMLECIRTLRERPDCVTDDLRALLGRLTSASPVQNPERPSPPS